jgi:hypothetical protein
MAKRRSPHVDGNRWLFPSIEAVLTQHESDATIDWHAQIERSSDFAREVLIKHGEMLPMFVIYTDGAIHVIQTKWKDRQQKRVVMHLMALKAASLGASAVVFMSEAWMSRPQRLPGETDAAFREGALNMVSSEAMDRIEVVVITASYHDADHQRRTVAETREIIRDAAGKPIDLKLMEAVDEDTSYTSGIELLSPRPLADFERELMRSVYDRMVDSVGFVEQQEFVHPTGHA